ncbi:MAG TPA: ATP-binding protein [Steroidobacteraceae bacterium]|nr:ATP-binding protein [Steroidobacteraceae bacterium]
MKLQQFMPRTVASQTTGLLIISVLLGVGLTAAAALYLYRTSSAPWSFETLSAVRAARIAAVVREAHAARSDAELRGVIAAARRSRMEVMLLSAARPGPASRAPWRSEGMARAVVSDLQDTWGIVPAGGPASAAAGSIAVDIGAGRLLVFQDAAPVLARRLIVGGAAVMVAVITFGVTLLSAYAVRWVTAPLSRIAGAARAFGREPSQAEALPEDGPLEIAQVAGALNEMRDRIRALVEERTRMLLAISHDLRTPLTRLALRAERVADDGLREGMQHDLRAVIDMLSETLAYLREGASAEPPRRVDLPSLLRTVCAEFSDVGHAVSYQGPGRLAVVCRDHALSRALTNVVDNATKHGKVVRVALQTLPGERVRIEVADDGPGIPAELRDKVLEPFFKIDRSRHGPGRAGFGLGLSIARDILHAQGGDIVLAGNERGGLSVQLNLPMACEAAAPADPGRAV